MNVLQASTGVVNGKQQKQKQNTHEYETRIMNNMNMKIDENK